MGYFPCLRRQPRAVPLLVFHDALLHLLSLAIPTTSPWMHYVADRSLQEVPIGPYHGSESRRHQLAAQGWQMSVALPSAPIIP
eukprot:1048066-Amphidinium_carterae.1